ncbi:hypothetical protein AB1484_12025 [Parafrankia sp. FMc6]|uniref:hypothetical protein n=1 Tax=Parafrankia soli TaxID=2599596 RepID=UPI0034D5AC0C
MTEVEQGEVRVSAAFGWFGLAVAVGGAVFLPGFLLGGEIAWVAILAVHPGGVVPVAQRKDLSFSGACRGGGLGG